MASTSISFLVTVTAHLTYLPTKREEGKWWGKEKGTMMGIHDAAVPEMIGPTVYCARRQSVLCIFCQSARKEPLSYHHITTLKVLGTEHRAGTNSKMKSEMV
jgi:hypothetical protein